VRVTGDGSSLRESITVSSTLSQGKRMNVNTIPVGTTPCKIPPFSGKHLKMFQVKEGTNSAYIFVLLFLSLYQRSNINYAILI
jgi:hypothetical protein